MKHFTTVLIMAALVVSFGCDKKKSKFGNPGNDSPRNKEEAIARLTTEQKQTFEKWQNQIVKSCDAAEAFGVGDDRDNIRQDSVDIGALLKSNNGSLVFIGVEKIVVLGGHRPIPGIGSSKVESSYELDGRRQSIVAETKRSGSHCQVFLYGQSVYEAYVAESVTITSQWLASRQTKIAGATPTIRRLGFSTKSEVTAHGLHHLIENLLKPSQEGQALMAEKLGLKESLASQLFKISDRSNDNLAIRIEGDQSALWSAADADELVGTANNLESLFGGESKSLSLEVRLGIPRFEFQDIKNDSDLGTLNFAASIGITKNASIFEYQSQKTSFNNFRPFDQSEGLFCVKDRALSYAGSSQSPDAIWPSVSFMNKPCKILYADIEDAGYASGMMKSLVGPIFAGVVPKRNFRYGDWDDVLSKLALELHFQGKDIRQELDSDGKTMIVGKIADYIERINAELDRSRHLRDHQPTLLKMGFQWAFNGESVQATKIAEILKAADNTIDTFQASTQALLFVIGQNSNAGTAELTFAAGIDVNYKTEAMRALNLSKELQFSDLEKDVFNKTLQKQVAIEEWQRWSSQLSAIKSEINRFANIEPSKGQLVGLSVKWLNSGDVQLQDLPSIYAAIDNVMTPFDTSTKKLLADLAKSLIDHKTSLEYARSISSEFKQLAITIRDQSKSMNFENWGQSFFDSVLQEMPSIDQVRAWGDMWRSAVAFANREQERTKEEFGSDNDRNLHHVISKAVEESWSSTEFQALESIAPVARGQNTCERILGYSSLASCGGLRLFSKSKNMFFDPSYSGRYAILGGDFTGYVNQLQGHDWTTLRWNLTGAFFGSFEPIWSKCDANAFSQKSNALKNQISAILGETDQFKKWELERNIKESLENCR